jgi:hypothetical protein
VGHAQFIEARDRCKNRCFAVIDVVGDADRVDSCEPERVAAYTRRRVKTFAVCRMSFRRSVEAALEVAENDIGGAQFCRDAVKGHGRIGDVHQIDVAREHQG